MDPLRINSIIRKVEKKQQKKREKRKKKKGKEEKGKEEKGKEKKKRKGETEIGKIYVPKCFCFAFHTLFFLLLLAARCHFITFFSSSTIV